MTSVVEFAQWIHWKAEWNPLKNKNDKFPHCYKRNLKIDPHDAANWMTYAEALAAGHPLGFVLTERDPFGFVDLDDAMGADNQWKPHQVARFETLRGAAAEISQSGTGFHIIGVCDPLLVADRRRKAGDVEFYTTKRFVALATPPTSWQGDFGFDITQAILQVVPVDDRSTRDVELTQGPRPEYTGPADDDELIQRMLASAGSVDAQFGKTAHVSKLWNADAAILCQVFPSPSQDAFDRSGADAALMAHLAFWTGADAARMDRLFRRSLLCRDKYRDRPDYRESTIRHAVSNCRKVFDHIPVKDAPATAMPALDGTTYLLIPKQVELFDGCVYVRDSHRVMIADGTMLRPDQFKSYFGGFEFQMQADGGRPSRNAYEAFTENRMHKFPKVAGSCFRPHASPGAIIDDRVNVYFPLHIQREAGDVAPFMDFLARFLPTKSDRAILLAYLAAMTQHVGRKFTWSVVLQGVEGNGKSMILSIMEYALGERYTHRPAAEDLKNPFNSYLENKLAILVDEVHMNGRREVLDILKPLITNTRVEIQPKGVDKKMIENVSNWIFATNHQDAVIKTRNDRRYAIFFTAQQDVEDLERSGMGGTYFVQLWDWLQNRGGFAKIAHFLSTYAIPDALNPAGSCNRAPNTSSTTEAVSASRGRAEQEIIEAVDAGLKGFRGGWISADAARQLLADRRIMLSPQKAAQMLTDLGYVRVGRSPTVIMDEDGARPVLFVVRSMFTATLGVDDYIAAQGYTRVGNVVRMPGL